MRLHDRLGGPRLLPLLAILLACDAKTEPPAPAALPVVPAPASATPVALTPDTDASPAKPTPERSVPSAPPAPAPVAVPSEHFVAPASPTPAPIVAQRRLVIPGGNIAVDPVGAIIAGRSWDWRHRGKEAALHHLELGTVVHASSEAGSEDSFDLVVHTADGERSVTLVVGVEPLLAAGSWYYADKNELLRMEVARPTGKRIATLPSDIHELRVHHDGLFIVHDREIDPDDVEVGEEYYTNYSNELETAEYAWEMESPGEPYVPALEYSSGHTISRMPLRGGKPAVVLDLHVSFDVWTIGGASSSVIAWHEGGGSMEYMELVEFAKKAGDPSFDAAAPGVVRVLELAAGASPRDVHVIAQGAKRPIHGLAIDGTHLYWFESREGERRALCRKPWASDGPAEDLAWADGLCEACTPYIHAGFVYWDGPRQVRRMPTGGGPIEMLPVATLDPAVLVAMPRDTWQPWTPPGTAR